MRIEWMTQKNGFGSVEYWWISEPLGTFIDVHPINTDQGTIYRVGGPQLEGRAEYATLERAKQVAEDLCVFSAAHPLEMVDIDLRDFPECGVQMYDAMTGKPMYAAQTIVGKRFVAPPR